MKAAIIRRYGSPGVIEVGELPTPTPGPGEILVRVRATSVSRTDCGELTGGVARLAYGLRRPRRQVFGMDVAGTVESVGANVEGFKVGDRVFGLCPGRRNGAQAEYVCLPETAPIALLPENIALEEAALCEGPFYASAMIRSLAIGPGKRLLVFGASGAIGSAAMQLALDRGADVTVAVEARHLDLMTSLGAPRVLDSRGAELAGLRAHFDVVYDAVGKMPIRQWRPLVKPDGVFATTDIGPKGQNLVLWLAAQLVRSKRIRIPVPTPASARPFVVELGEMLAGGRFRGVFDRSFTLDQIREAYEYASSGRKTGIVPVILP